MKYTVAQFAKDKGFDEDMLRGFGVRDSIREGSACVEIPYFMEDASEYDRIRLRINGGKDGHRWSEGDKPVIPYGLNRPIPYDKKSLLVVEGESDCFALWTHGFPALGVPGATNTGCLQLRYVADTTQIYVIQEPGNAGDAFPRRVASKLYEAGYQGVVYAVALPHKDPREMMLQVGDKFGDALRAALRGRKKMERPKPNPTRGKPENDKAMIKMS